jgi:hypothetical protein
VPNVTDPRRPLLFPTPPDRLCDAQGRPYFLWDSDMTLDAFRAALADPDPEVRAAYLGKLMRQAKPDDVFQFVRLDDIVAAWPRLERDLGRERAMWRYLLDRWQEVRRADVAAESNADRHPAREVTGTFGLRALRRPHARIRRLPDDRGRQFAG